MSVATHDVAGQLEQHRRELTAHCYRTLLRPVEVDDAVQETFIRAWRSFERFEGRSSLRSWLYRIATNVCLDMLGGRERRPGRRTWARGEPVVSNLHMPPEVTWIEPIPDALVVAGGRPRRRAVARETIRLAFVAALQHLPPRQRAVLILCEVLRWQASEAAEPLETTVASVNSALQRARATLESNALPPADPAPELDAPTRELLRVRRRVRALRHGGAHVAHPRRRDAVDAAVRPLAPWPRGHLHVVVQARHRVQRLARVSRPSPRTARRPRAVQAESRAAQGYEPWALQVLEVGEAVVELTFFLDTQQYPSSDYPPGSTTRLPLRAPPSRCPATCL